VYKAAADITYTAVANGTSGTTTSTQIALTFSAAVTGLTAGDITVTNGTGSATKGALTGSGTAWSLAITVATQGNVSVSISKTGIESAAKTVAVYKAASGGVLTVPDSHLSDPGADPFDIWIIPQTSWASVTDVVSAWAVAVAGGDENTTTGDDVSLFTKGASQSTYTATPWIATGSYAVLYIDDDGDAFVVLNVPFTGGNATVDVDDFLPIPVSIVELLVDELSMTTTAVTNLIDGLNPKTFGKLYDALGGAGTFGGSFDDTFGSMLSLDGVNPVTTSTPISTSTMVFFFGGGGGGTPTQFTGSWIGPSSIFLEIFGEDSGYSDFNVDQGALHKDGAVMFTPNSASTSGTIVFTGMGANNDITYDFTLTNSGNTLTLSNPHGNGINPLGGIGINLTGAYSRAP
jgi:hypothetical protein